MVRIEKGYAGKRPRTVISVTADGRRRFAHYVADLKRIVPGLGD